MKTLDALVEKALSRRSFLAGAGVTAASVAIAGCSNSSSPATTAPPTTTPTPTTSPTASAPTDADYLNYALNLEYLEAQFYLYAATGSGLSQADMVGGANSGFTTAGTLTLGNAKQVGGLTTTQQEILNEIAFEEQAHVRFLRGALSTAAVAMPSIDLSFFGPLAVAAGIFTDPTLFNPFVSFDAFLVGAFIFEDVGVTAYSGAAGLISAAGVAKGYLTAAAGILAVEAYHAGYIRTSLTGANIAAQAAGKMYPYLGYANQVAALRDKLTVMETGSVETALVLPSSITSPSAIVAADPVNAIGFARNVNQVHHIVYGNAAVGTKSGGFFPNGTNSIFATTTA